MTEYRVDELATESGVSVEALRSYQSKGLLPPPRRQGRVALYGPRHLERLRTILELKQRGHSLRAIRAMLAEAGDGAAGRAHRQLTATEDEPLTLAELADRAHVPAGLVRSLEASGILQPLRVGDDRSYTVGDVRAVRMLLSLVGGGVPMEEFMRVARNQIDAATAVAEGAVGLFLRYVREPLLGQGLDPEVEADRLVTAFRLMLQAATGLIAYNIQRTMLNLIEEEIGRMGTGSERTAFQREVARRRLEIVLPA